ncbi:GNAT family N-acetyltransferase [Paenibacillus tarimensis]
MTEEIIVRAIDENQIELFASILQEAAEWLREQGIEMWTREQIRVERLLQQNDIHEMFIGYVSGAPVATMMIQEMDAFMWPQAVKNKDSLYLHKLSVRRAWAKSGCSSAMIGWAKEEAGRRGKSYLRLDCAADRPKLNEFYESHGFIKVKEVLINQRYPTALYEWACNGNNKGGASHRGRTYAKIR